MIITTRIAIMGIRISVEITVTVIIGRITGIICIGIKWF
jgi:hypothetical protein